jgi:hypothetical protein
MRGKDGKCIRGVDKGQSLVFGADLYTKFTNWRRLVWGEGLISERAGSRRGSGGGRPVGANTERQWNSTHDTERADVKRTPDTQSGGLPP